LKRIRTMPKRLSALLAATILLFWIAYPVVSYNSVHAAQLSSRKLLLSSSAIGTVSTDVGGVAVPPGNGGNGQKAKHTVTFTLTTNSSNDGSILIMYCDDPIPQATCNTPTGMTAANVAAVTVTGGLVTTHPYAIDLGTTNATINTAIGTLGVCNGASTTRTNCVALKRSTADTEGAGPTTATIAYGGGSSDYITNPTVDNYSFFARIYVFTDTAWTKANLLDNGSVAASTAQQIDITAKVKEVLNFSVADVTGLVAPGLTCTPLTAGTNGAVALGDVNGVLSFTTAYDVHSYFRISTNANGGTTVYYSGDTLKNGANSITATGTTAVISHYGTKQFGIGIDSGDTQGGNGYSFTDLTSAAQYANGAGTINAAPFTSNTALFAFDTASTTAPVIIASAAGPVTCDTGSVRYLGNISVNTPAGIYTTTITYIALGVY